MITTLVQFQLPAAITLEEASRRFEDERAEIPEPRRADPQVLHPLRGWAHRRWYLSLGVPARGRTRL